MDVDGQDYLEYFVMKEGVDPSDAIEAIFTPTKDNPTILDCERTMVASMYRALLKTLGKEAFDRMFSGTNAPVISKLVSPEQYEGKERGRWGAQNPIYSAFDRYEKDWTGNADDSFDSNWRGAISYMRNSWRYPTGGGAWAGEWVAYVGHKSHWLIFNKAEFIGFIDDGSGVNTEAGWKSELAHYGSSAVDGPAIQTDEVAGFEQKLYDASDPPPTHIPVWLPNIGYR